MERLARATSEGRRPHAFGERGSRQSQYRQIATEVIPPNRVAGGFSPPAPTAPGTRDRTGRFASGALSAIRDAQDGASHGLSTIAKARIAEGRPTPVPGSVGGWAGSPARCPSAGWPGAAGPAPPSLRAFEVARRATAAMLSIETSIGLRLGAKLRIAGGTSRLGWKSRRLSRLARLIRRPAGRHARIEREK